MSSDNQLNYGLDTDTIDIADSVIIDVATKTLSTIPGIHSLSPRFYDELVEGITHAFGQRSLPGINVKHRKGFIEINIYIKALYGYNLIELSKQLQSEIKQTLKNMLDLDHVKVDVHIEGIVKEKDVYKRQVGYVVGLGVLVYATIGVFQINSISMIVTYIINRFLNRYIVKELGGTTGDTYGFVVEVTEVLLILVYLIILSILSATVVANPTMF